MNGNELFFSIYGITITLVFIISYIRNIAKYNKLEKENENFKVELMNEIKRLEEKLVENSFGFEKIKGDLNEMREMKKTVENAYTKVIIEKKFAEKIENKKFENLDEIKEKIKQLLEEGKSEKEISNKLEIHHGTLQTILNFENYPKAR